MYFASRNKCIIFLTSEYDINSILPFSSSNIFFRTRVSNPRAARLYYAARGYIFKLCRDYRNYTIFQGVRIYRYISLTAHETDFKKGCGRLPLKVA